MAAPNTTNTQGSGSSGGGGGSGSGIIPNNLSHAQILQLLNSNPNFLSEAERQLPEEQQVALLQAKVAKLIQQQHLKTKQQQAQQQQQQAQQQAQQPQQQQQAGPAPAQAQAQAPAPPQQAVKARPGRPPAQAAAQNNASPRVPPQPQQQQQQQPNMQEAMRMQQQQQQQQQQPPGPHQQQQQQQQQQHFQQILERTQRLQQTNLAQQQQQQMQQMAAMHQQQQQQQGQPTPVQPHAQLPHPPNMTAPSPQQGVPGPGQSPMIHHPSPNPNQQQRMSQSGPTPPNKSVPNVQTIIDNFPTLYRRKHAGQLAVEQENLFDQFLRTEPGQLALQRFQSQEANALVQNNLANPVSQGHQMPPMTQAQLQMAAQQQLAPLQQQQQQQAQQAQHQAAASLAQVQAAHQLAQQQQQFQNLVQGGRPQPQMDQQQFQQMQLRQLAQANMNRAQGATNMLNQASALARAQAQMHAQQQQMGDPSQVQGQMGYGSPRPPPQQMLQPQQQQQQGPPQPNMQQQQQQTAQQQKQQVNMRQTIARLSAMPEAQREQIFATKPEIRTVYYANINQLGLGPQGQSPQVGAGTPGGMPNRPPLQPQQGNASNFPIPNNVPVNLHIPAGKQRNSSIGNNAQQPGSSASPQMRPPPIQPQGGTPGAAGGPPNQAQIQTIQRMIQQGIPIQQAAQAQQQQGYPRGPMNPAMFANQQQQQQQQAARQTPEQFMHSQQGGADGGNRAAAGPQAFRNGGSDAGAGAQHYAGMDRSQGSLARTTWAPTAEYDSTLRDKLGEFRPSLRMRNGGRRGDRVLGDVLLEKMPEEIKAIADEVEMVGEGDMAGDETSGYPGQKKRKVQELAEGVDKGLVIDEDVETLLLKLADEHVDMVGQYACGLAKHRKSDTLDRKDLQLAYEMFGRVFPAFASDSIRMDQARSNRRLQPASTSVRASRLRAVNEHKALLKREKEEARLRQLREKDEEAALARQQQVLLSTANGTSTGTATPAAAVV